MNYHVIDGSILQDILGQYLNNSKIVPGKKYRIYIEPEEELKLTPECIESEKRADQEYKNGKGTLFTSLEDGKAFLDKIWD
jgi:hypothetical protein